MILNKLVLVSALALGTSALAQEYTPTALNEYVCEAVKGFIVRKDMCVLEGELSYFVTGSTADILLCANVLLQSNAPIRTCFILSELDNAEAAKKLSTSLGAQGINVLILKRATNDTN